jgi:hypothetical protein
MGDVEDCINLAGELPDCLVRMSGPHLCVVCDIGKQEFLEGEKDRPRESGEKDEGPNCRGSLEAPTWLPLLPWCPIS